MTNILKYAKFLIAVLTGAISVLTAAVNADGTDWRQVLVAAVGAGLVLLVPNKGGTNGQA